MKVLEIIHGWFNKPEPEPVVKLTLEEEIAKAISDGEKQHQLARQYAKSSLEREILYSIKFINSYGCKSKSVNSTEWSKSIGPKSTKEIALEVVREFRKQGTIIEYAESNSSVRIYK